jgi:hypothetical protein
MSMANGLLLTMTFLSLLREGCSWSNQAKSMLCAIIALVYLGNRSPMAYLLYLNVRISFTNNGIGLVLMPVGFAGS